MTKNNKSFTMMELLVVIVIVGILSTLSITQYGVYRENVLNREAQANLRLISAAERVRRMESNNNLFIACTTNDLIRTNLRVDITATGSNPNWNYQVYTYTANTIFCAEATRSVGGRQWRMRMPTAAVPDPQPTVGACP